MRLILEILTVVAVAVALAQALAHAMELPGKLRLSREHYLATQSIYYPGFTFGGMAEPLAILLLVLMLWLLRGAGAEFWLTCGALVSMVAMHAAYWFLTHPVNNFWLEGQPLKGAGAAFFRFGARDGTTTGWTDLRDRWERSHVVRAVLGMVALILLVAAIAVT